MPWCVFMLLDICLLRFCLIQRTFQQNEMTACATYSECTWSGKFLYLLRQELDCSMTAFTLANMTTIYYRHCWLCRESHGDLVSAALGQFYLTPFEYVEDQNGLGEQKHLIH